MSWNLITFAPLETHFLLLSLKFLKESCSIESKSTAFVLNEAYIRRIICLFNQILLFLLFLAFHSEKTFSEVLFYFSFSSHLVNTTFNLDFSAPAIVVGLFFSFLHLFGIQMATINWRRSNTMQRKISLPLNGRDHHKC